MKKFFGLMIFIAVITSVNANAGGYTGKIGAIRIFPGEVYVGTTTQPSQTCSNFGASLWFKPNTPDGKNLLAILTVAKTTGVQVSIWYSDSSAVGATEANGCGQSAMAIISGVSLD